MKKRIITAVIGLPILFALLILGNWDLFAAVFLLSNVGMYEYCKALNQKLENKISFLLMFVLSSAMIFVIKWDLFIALPMMCLALTVIFCFEIFSKNADAMRAISCVFALLYVPVSFSFLLLFEAIQNGQYFLWMIFIIAFITDTFAYFTGRALKGPKLAPAISPKKTRSGAIGGLIFAAIAMLIYGIVLHFSFQFTLPYYLYILVGVVASITGQCGDLAASMIKRKMEIKDFGKILPGHGGILDRFDSILFIIPVVFVFAIFVSGMC